jgi:hypothetical protein
VFLKAFCLGMVRPNAPDHATPIQKQRILVPGVRLNQKKIAAYCRVCGFASDGLKSIPVSYFQTLFVGLLGKCITAENFPITPLGLIHVFQSFCQVPPGSCRRSA